MRAFASLRRRADFSRLRQRGRRIATRSLTIYRTDAYPSDPSSFVGIAINASIGKAVIRNTLRRRIGAILHQELSERRLRLLIVARPGAPSTAFSVLRAELVQALA